MKKHHNPLRPATAALFAALVLPIAPVFAQDTLTAPSAPAPVIAAPPPVIAAPPPPLTAAPPPAVRPAPAPVPAPAARTATPTPVRTRAPARTATRAPAPARTVTPAPVQAPAPAPMAQAPAESAPPPAPVETLPPPVDPTEALPVEPQAEASNSPLLWILGGLALLALIVGLFLFRRRRPDAVYEEAAYEPAPARDPVLVAPLDVSPVAAEPILIRPVADPVPGPRALAEPVADAPDALPPPEEISVSGSDHADIEALAASSSPIAGRPWLEFLLRPLRAGTNRDNTIVEFELTVGNTGNVDARDVRISTWVVAAGAATDMERSLIDPPADATTQSVDIEAGEGATVEARIGLAKDGSDDSILPVVVADARYTLPDGTLGRTRASFAIGVPEDDGSALQPFLTDRSSGLRENVEARLYGEPERV